MFGLSLTQVGAIGFCLLIGTSAGAYAFGYQRGHFQALLDRAEEEKKAIAKAAEEARALGIAEGFISITAGQRFAQDQQKIVDRTIALLPEIPVVYVTPRAVRAYPINLGIVRVLNAAARSDDPAAAFPLAAGQSDDDTAATDLASLAANVATNYGACNQTRAQLADLIGWLDEQRRLHNADAK